MDLREIQKKQKEFILSRRWDRFSATQVFSHLIEELGEVVKFFLYEEGYKVKGAGHEGINRENMGSEFAQAFNLFLQLAIAANIDLEEVWKKEMKKMEQRFSEQVWKDLAEKT
ncbi:MAG: hypothetical protein D6732_19330 [Methanobacteriota archaeon]|nr:MAG: hypothetical protein D6732_19330 [Euryarchaeota archaeon]